jgi:hypothetical protein
VLTASWTYEPGEIEGKRPETLSATEQDILKHGAVLALLADMHIHRFLSDKGRPRRMSALKLRDLALAYARIAQAHSRLLTSVGVERRAKDEPLSLADIRQRFAQPTGSARGDDAG